jgi:predicted DNA-binding transcriptional regulator AlpA
MKAVPESNPVSASSVKMQLLTLEQVADMLQVSKDWVRDHCTRRNPRLPVIRLGGRRALLRFRQEDVEKFIVRHFEQGSVE